MTTEWTGADGLTITISEDAGDRAAARVAAALAAEITAGFGPRAEQPFSIVAASADTVVGGLNAATHWGWCYIRHLWVERDRRRSGLGRRLLDAALIQARARDCAGVYVDTFDSGAAIFYERAGFAPFGRIAGFPPGHTRIFLCKRLD